MTKIKVDAEMLIMALEDTSGFGEFYLDQESGNVTPVFEELSDGEIVGREDVERQPKRYVLIDSMPSHESFEIMEDFVAQIKDTSIQRKLSEVLKRRKPFRQFKDALLDYPDIRQQWFKYHFARMTKLAELWLEENEISAELVISPPLQASES